MIALNSKVKRVRRMIKAIVRVMMNLEGTLNERNLTKISISKRMKRKTSKSKRRKIEKDQRKIN